MQSDNALELSIEESIATIRKQAKDHPSAISTVRNLLDFWKMHHQGAAASFPFQILVEATRFAAAKHGSRTATTEVPSIVHPLKVTALLWKEGAIRDETILLGALLHDTLADTSSFYEEIAAAFGEKVGVLVQELTFPKELSFDQQIDQCKKMSIQARIIKIADCTHSLQALLDPLPLVWDADKAGTLLLQCYHFFQAIRGVHGKLEEVFASAMEKIAGYVPEEI